MSGVKDLTVLGPQSSSDSTTQHGHNICCRCQRVRMQARKERNKRFQDIAKMPELALSVFRRRCEAGDALLRISTPKLDRLHVSPHKKLFELILSKV